MGEEAIQNAPIARQFQISFKKFPSEMDENERYLMVSFMKGVYAGIIDRHPDFVMREHRVFIARPSQDDLWLKEETAYIKIAEDAGLPVAGIQKESRAAFFRARTQADSKIDKHVEKGVLIVDFGSSTIDFTYLNKKSEKPIDGGANLGANAVETALLQYAIEHPQDAIMPDFARYFGTKIHSNAYNQLLYKFRVAKEEFYGKKLTKFKVSIDYSLITSAETHQLPLSGGIPFGGFTISKNEVRKILEDKKYGAYIKSVEEAIKTFKETKLKDNAVAMVYLTGGASRMDFVREIFSNVFSLPIERCLSDDEPSLIVSQGVAHLSYADYKTAGKGEELRRKARKIIDSFDWEGRIRTAISDSVISSIKSKVYSIMCDYRDNRIYEYHTLSGGKEGDTYFCMEGDHDEGLQKVRNINALKKVFTSTFEGYVRSDFAKECEPIIKENVINAIDAELKRTFSAFEFEQGTARTVSVTGLSARMSNDGAGELRRKFTLDGKGHVIYDAVASCYPFGAMIGWDVMKDRWDSDRKQHFNYYSNNNYSIFSTYGWEYFIKNNITISGVSSAKNQIIQFVDKLVDEYIKYAQLAIFFK